MKSRKVLKMNNLPARIPIFKTLSTGIALDYWNAPQWLWGALGLFFLIGWIVAIYEIVTQESVDLFKNSDS